MKREQLQELAQAANFEALRRAVEALCQPFGKPKRICFLPDKHRDEYVCFLERGSTDLNSSIIEDLGGFYFAQGVVFRIPFKQANMNETISARSLGKEAVPSPAN